MTKATKTKPTSIELEEKIDSATVNNIMEEIEHDQIILTVAKPLLKEVVKDAIDLVNKEKSPSFQKVIDHINGQEWSDLFAESVLRTVDLIKDHLSTK